MYFLVILICLTINYVWLKDLDRFNDSWFFKFYAQVEQLTAKSAPKLTHGWWLPLLIVYAVPLLVVAALILFLQDIFFGIVVMLVHILVLLIAFDRTQPGKLASDFLVLWKQGDLAACAHYLDREMATTAVDLAATTDSAALAAFFSKQLIYRCFEKMFVMFFWYMVAGPLGVVFCYVTYQLRDSRTGEAPEKVRHTNQILLRVLEWAPMRLLVLSFSLVGNFVKCFARLQEIFWDFSLDADYAALLHDFSDAALSGNEQEAKQEEQAQANREAAQRARIAGEIEQLQALLERSQLIWLCVLALITVFGINN